MKYIYTYKKNSDEVRIYCVDEKNIVNFILDGTQHYRVVESNYDGEGTLTFGFIRNDEIFAAADYSNFSIILDFEVIHQGKDFYGKGIDRVIVKYLDHIEEYRVSKDGYYYRHKDFKKYQEQYF